MERRRLDFCQWTWCCILLYCIATFTFLNFFSLFNLVTSKISLLRKQQQPAERIAPQKSPGSGPLGGNTNSRVFTSSGGNIALPRGVRKKVTTSLFILACIFVVNFSVTPFGQLGSSLSASFGGAKNVVATSFGKSTSTTGTGATRQVS